MLAMIPKSYRILHSEQADKDGVVSLRVASTDIYGDGVRIRVAVTDTGSTKTVRIVPDTSAGV